MSTLDILFVENHSVFAHTVIDAFLSTHVVELVTSIAAANEAAATREYDVALVDFDLDDGKGDEFVAHLRASGSRTLVIGVSSHAVGNEALMRAGAERKYSASTAAAGRSSSLRSSGTTLCRP